MATLSVVIPLYNEEDNVGTLVARTSAALSDYPHAWELICVDDGSSDQTVQALLAVIAQHDRAITLIELQRNYGQTAALQAGIDAAQGELIATLDGDLQNDPADIPLLVAELERRNLDLIQGWRQRRQDGWLLRKIPSKIANRLIGRVTGLKLHDYGCSLKVYRASIIKQIRLFGEMHRFIPLWVAQVTKPSRIGEMPVRHHARQFGESKYGISRTFRVMVDLLAVFFFLKFKARPGHFFGQIGLAIGGLGGLIMGYLAVLKFGLGDDIGDRPLFFIGILLLVAAAQFLTTGVLAEMVTRVMSGTTNLTSYRAREVFQSRDAGLGANIKPLQRVGR